MLRFVKDQPCRISRPTHRTWRAAQFEEVDHRAEHPYLATLQRWTRSLTLSPRSRTRPRLPLPTPQRSWTCEVLEAAIRSHHDGLTCRYLRHRCERPGGQYLTPGLHRMEMVSFAWFEGHLAVMAGPVGPGRCRAWNFAHRNHHRRVDALVVARERGATTISVTNYEMSPICCSKWIAPDHRCPGDHVPVPVACRAASHSSRWSTVCSPELPRDHTPPPPSWSCFGITLAMIRRR